MALAWNSAEARRIGGIVSRCVAAILGGSVFALVLSDPTTFTVGASGGLFGLMGGLLVIALMRLAILSPTKTWTSGSPEI